MGEKKLSRFVSYLEPDMAAEGCSLPRELRWLKTNKQVQLITCPGKESKSGFKVET